MPDAIERDLAKKGIMTLPGGIVIVHTMRYNTSVFCKILQGATCIGQSTK